MGSVRRFFARFKSEWGTEGRGRSSSEPPRSRIRDREISRKPHKRRSRSPKAHKTRSKSRHGRPHDRRSRSIGGGSTPHRASGRPYFAYYAHNDPRQPSHHPNANVHVQGHRGGVYDSSYLRHPQDVSQNQFYYDIRTHNGGTPNHSYGTWD